MDSNYIAFKSKYDLTYQATQHPVEAVVIILVLLVIFSVVSYFKEN